MLHFRQYSVLYYQNNINYINQLQSFTEMPIGTPNTVKSLYSILTFHIVVPLPLSSIRHQCWTRHALIMPLCKTALYFKMQQNILGHFVAITEIHFSIHNRIPKQQGFFFSLVGIICVYQFLSHIKKSKLVFISCAAKSIYDVAAFIFNEIFYQFIDNILNQSDKK